MATADQPADAEWYRLRRRIEDWFRLLKTECWFEALQHAVTLRAVSTGLGDWPHSPAWVGRDTPELPTKTMLTVLREPDLG